MTNRDYIRLVPAIWKQLIQRGRIIVAIDGANGSSCAAAGSAALTSSASAYTGSRLESINMGSKRLTICFFIFVPSFVRF